MQNLRALASRLIARTPIQYIPVTVQKGLAKGARWTLLPWSFYWRGYGEMDVEAAIRLYGSAQGATCWDLGAHFGFFTVGMAMAVGETGQVVGFEPDPVSFERCRLHVKMNSLNWVKLYNAAVSDSEGSANLILTHGAGDPTSHFAYEDERTDAKTRGLTVRTVVLDRLVERGKIRPPQFIKLDIEGHGAKALWGARKTIADHLPVCMMYFHSSWELDGTRKLLEPLGYRCFTAEGEELKWQDSMARNTVLRPVDA